MHVYVCNKSASWLNCRQKADPATLHLSASEQHSSRFYLESRFSTNGERESSVPLFEMPPGNVGCGFKVPKRIPSPLCFEWIKKNILSISVALPADMLLRLSCQVFWIWAVPRVILKEVFAAACFVVTAEELPVQHVLSAHCAESSQTKPFSYFFPVSLQYTQQSGCLSRKTDGCVEVEHNRTGGERGKESGVENRRVGGYWSQKRVLVSQWKEIVETNCNFLCGIPCNWVV